VVACGRNCCNFISYSNSWDNLGSEVIDMKDKNAGVDWDICKKCGVDYVRIDSSTCLKCHEEEDE